MKRVLIADDSSFMRNIMKRILTKNGHVVVGEAENGRVAFEKYKELLPDVVTLDITMKEMDGIEALKEIINFDQNANAIMVSAMGQQSFIDEAFAAGAKDFFVKPLKEAHIISVLSRL